MNRKQFIARCDAAVKLNNKGALDREYLLIVEDPDSGEELGDYRCFAREPRTAIAKLDKHLNITRLYNVTAVS